MMLHSSPVTLLPSDHYPPSSISPSLYLSPSLQVCTKPDSHKRVWLRETSRRLSSPSPQSLPCLCVGEFGELHFTELQAQARSDAPRKFRVGVAGEHFYVRHGGKGSRGTCTLSLRSKVTNEGSACSQKFKGHWDAREAYLHCEYVHLGMHELCVCTTMDKAI